jgi:hypothetical protein
MNLTISPRRIGSILVCIVLFLTLAALVGQISKYIFGHDYLLGFVPLFDLSEDVSIPTWYASFTLLFSSFLLLLIGINKRRDKEPFSTHWIIMAAIFLLLSIDETARIHETLGDVLTTRSVTHTKGYFYYSWVLFGIAAVSVFVLAYIKFIFHLPFKTAIQFIVSGAIYVGGALFIEMLNGNYDELYGHNNLTYQLSTIFEEFMEMVGIVLFIYAISSYMLLNVKAFSVSIKESAKPIEPSTVRVSQPELVLSK